LPTLLHNDAYLRIYNPKAPAK